LRPGPLCDNHPTDAPRAMTSRERQRRRNRRRSDPARAVLLVIVAAVVVCGLALGAGALYVSAVASDIPALNKIPVKQQTSSVIYAGNGEELGIVGGDSIRVPISRSEMPRILKEATVAIEDQRFYQTGAIDLPSIFRAALADLVTGKTVQGGSTIAMQLANNLYLGDAQTFERKVKEAVIAERLSQRMSKAEILADYLNTVPYGTVGGQTAYGVQAAARMFFNEPAAKLTLVQAALLAGLPQAPSQYNPFEYPVAARNRRNQVLAKLAQLGYVSDRVARAAEGAQLGTRHSTYYQQRKYPYFFNFIVSQLAKRYGKKVVEEGGLKIYTTLNPHVQYLAESAIRQVLVDPGDPASAEVVEDPHDGRILGMAQSGSYANNQLNYATQILRQPGSTFKAIVLAEALSRGIDPFTTLYLSHTLEAGWLPGYPTYTVMIDGGGSLDAPLDIEEALVASDNTVFAQLAADLGESSVTAMAHRLGVTTYLHSYPAEALGGLTRGVSPLEMANVYSTIADGGWRNKQISITKVVFPNGRVDRSWGRPKRTKVLSSAAASVETQILHDNVIGGTATQSAITCPSAAKTGTTSNLVDAWLDGFTPNYTAVVWMGYPQADIPMDDVQGQAQYGGDLPADIWHDTMDTLAVPPCAPWRSAPAMTYVPFSGTYQQAGFASYVAPKKKTHHPAAPNGAGGTPTTTTTPPATTTPTTTVPGATAPSPTGAT
jgi:penicillin-binding protein 1A